VTLPAVTMIPAVTGPDAMPIRNSIWRPAIGVVAKVVADPKGEFGDRTVREIAPMTVGRTSGCRHALRARSEVDAAFG